MASTAVARLRSLKRPTRLLLSSTDSGILRQRQGEPQFLRDLADGDRAVALEAATAGFVSRSGPAMLRDK
jgi:hypothetical protein